MQEFNENDNVLLYSEELQKHVIGKILELKPDLDTFFYMLYYNSEDLPQNLKTLNHFSAFELFSTEENKKEKIANIKEKVPIYNLLEYIQKEVPNGDDLHKQKYYISRTNFDISTSTFTPDLSITQECFCGLIINPDQPLVACIKCNKKVYHYNCLKPNTQCLECGQLLTKEMYNSNELRLKRNRSQAGLPLSREQSTMSNVNRNDEDDNGIDENDLQAMQKVRKQIKTNKIQELFSKLSKKDKAAEQKTSEIQEQMKKEKSLEKPRLQKQVSAKQKAPAAKQYSNLKDEQISTMNILVDRYRTSSCTSRLQGIEKKRHDVKERLIKLIIYGVMEIKNQIELNEHDYKDLLRLNQTPEQLDKQREEIKAQFDSIKEFTEQGIYDFARQLAISIEITLYRHKNSQNKFQLTNEYKDRFRILNQNLLDDMNQLLRLKVLLKSLTVQELIEIQEEKLYNPKKKLELERLKEKEFQQGQIKNSGFTYIKTNKAEIEIMKDNDEEELEKRRKEEERLEKLRQEQELLKKKQKELEEKGRDFDYRQFTEVSTKAYKLDILKDSLENVNQKQVDFDLIQNLIELTAGNGKARMLKRIESDLPKSEGHHLLQQLENF